MKIFFLNVSLLLLCIFGTSQCYGQMDFGPDPLVTMTEASIEIPLGHVEFYSPISAASHHSTAFQATLNRSSCLLNEEI